MSDVRGGYNMHSDAKNLLVDKEVKGWEPWTLTVPTFYFQNTEETPWSLCFENNGKISHPESFRLTSNGMHFQQSNFNVVAKHGVKQQDGGAPAFFSDGCCPSGM